MRTKNFQIYKLGFKEAEEPEIILPTFVRSCIKQGSSKKNIYYFFTDYDKMFDCMDHYKLWKILEELHVQDYFTCLLRPVCGSKSSSYNLTWNKLLVPNWERSMTRLYIITLLIQLLCRIHRGIKTARRNINNFRFVDDTI